MEPFLILGIPLLGTTMGSAMVFSLGKELHKSVEALLLGFAAGVMIAASVWSLLLPAIELAEGQEIWGWIPAALGFLAGMICLLGLDTLTAWLYKKTRLGENGQTGLSRTSMLILAVTLHNLPEGMAVGVILAGAMLYENSITMAGALTFALGIAIQNIPEGAIISMPFRSGGYGKGRSFGYGVLSGIVEPIGAVLTILLADLIIQVLPYLLSFAAGAMIYVVIKELIPECQEGKSGIMGTLGVAFGFVLMMVLDVILG